MERAEELIDLYKIELGKISGFRTLFQNAADLIFPRESQITGIKSSGAERTTEIFDNTAVMASIEMASGLSINLIPPGQRFFAVRASNRSLNEVEAVKRALGYITEITHEKMFMSNFLLQLNETLRSLVVFGTGNLYSEFVADIGLNYRDYDIAMYVPLENSKGRIDTMMMEFPYTARQAVQEYGEENVGSIIKEAYKEEKTRGDIFRFLHIVRPRKERNPRLEDNFNMPFESIFIAIKEKLIVKEGGFEEFPYHTPRWTKSSCEVLGRGQGTFILPDVRVLQVMRKSFNECGDKQNNPPLEVRDSFEGKVSVTPGALNFVRDMGDIRAIHREALGNFPVTKEALEMQRDIIKKAFYNDVFIQLMDLKGDRRTQLEIYERIREGLQRLGPPIGRIYEELFNTLITRTILLLFRNGEFPPLPAELAGQAFKIEYIGPLAMMLRSQQAKGFERLVGIVAEMDTAFPDIKPSDNLNIDSGVRRLGETLGVNTEDIATQEEVAEKRRIRAEELMQQQLAMAAETAADAYKKTSGAAEEGSPAEAVMSGI